MYIGFNIQPEIKTFKSKNDIYTYLSSIGYNFEYRCKGSFHKNNKIFVYPSVFAGSIMLFNCEKHNRKAKTFIDLETGKKVRKVVREGKWVVWFYKFPDSYVKYAKQNSRNFELELQIGDYYYRHNLFPKKISRK